MVTVKYESTLIYCDGPQVILLEGHDNKTYLGVSVECNESYVKFFVIELFTDLYNSYSYREIDLLTLINECYSRTNLWFITDISNYNADIILEEQYEPMKCVYLPDQGFYSY